MEEDIEEVEEEEEEEEEEVNKRQKVARNQNTKFPAKSRKVVDNREYTDQSANNYGGRLK